MGAVITEPDRVPCGDGSTPSKRYSAHEAKAKRGCSQNLLTLNNHSGSRAHHHLSLPLMKSSVLFFVGWKRDHHGQAAEAEITSEGFVYVHTY